jgi:hypothetical protein
MVPLKASEGINDGWSTAAVVSPICTSEGPSDVFNLEHWTERQEGIK